MTKEYICYYCKEKINSEELIEWENNKAKKFRSHVNCRHEFLTKQQLKDQDRQNRLKEKQTNKELWQNEQKELNKVYSYLQDILNFNKPLSKQAVMSIQNLRAGHFVKNGTKVFLSKDGYPYEVILLTLKLKRQDIDRALKNKLSDKDIDSKIKYTMAIIRNSIADIYLRWENKQKQQEKMQQIIDDVPQIINIEYIPSERKDNKELSDLW